MNVCSVVFGPCLTKPDPLVGDRQINKKSVIKTLAITLLATTLITLFAAFLVGSAGLIGLKLGVHPLLQSLGETLTLPVVIGTMGTAGGLIIVNFIALVLTACWKTSKEDKPKTPPPATKETKESSASDESESTEEEPIDLILSKIKTVKANNDYTSLVSRAQASIEDDHNKRLYVAFENKLYDGFDVIKEGGNKMSIPLGQYWIEYFYVDASAPTRVCHEFDGPLDTTKVKKFIPEYEIRDGFKLFS